MASDGRNQPLPAWSQRVPGRADPDPFPQPDVSKVTLPGEPKGLFPRASLDADVILEIPEWDTLPSDPGEKEKVNVTLARPGTSNYATVDTVDVTTGTTTFPLKVKIPSAWLLDDLNEGAFNLRYHHINYLGTPGYSVDTLVFIDKIPPHGTAAPDKLTLSITPPITDDKLAGLTDIEATVPAWTGGAEGDVVAFTVVEGKLPDDPNDIVPIDIVPLGADRKIKFPVSLIRALRDGDYCFGYVIADKAGNRSRISGYDLIPVALGIIPPLPYPGVSVPEAADGKVDRADAVQGVFVEFVKILHAKPTDEIAILWGGKELSYRTPVGSNPPNLMSVAVDWAHMRDAYGTATAPVETDVEYKLYRGTVALGGAATKVWVDFSKAGPDNPNPEPGNPDLLPLAVHGDSDVPNELVAGDENKTLVAKIELYDPLTDKDELQVLWNGVPIGSPRKIDPANDNPGDDIEIDITDWDIIRKEGNNTKMPVTYRLTNPDFHNPQEPLEPTEVEITFLTVTLPPAEPQNLFNGRLTCLSLHFEGAKVGFQYLIPKSDYLKEGMTVSLAWKAYHTKDAPVHVPSADKTATYGPISAAEAANGFLWFIEPYDTHILPTWASATNQLGIGEVIYTLDVGGVPTPSTASKTQVGLTQGGGTCDLTPPAP